MKLDLSNPAWQQTLPPGRSVAGDAPAAACAFSKEGSIAAFALGDGRVRLLPADINVAQGERHRRPILAEGARGRRRVGCNGTARRQGLLPGRI